MTSKHYFVLGVVVSITKDRQVLEIAVLIPAELNRAAVSASLKSVKKALGLREGKTAAQKASLSIELWR